MQKLLMSVIVAALIATPAQARDPAVDLGPGAFVGARVKLPFGGNRGSAKPQAGFAIAPTRSSVSNAGVVRTQIGEGFMLDFASSKPTLTLAGIRADTALGLQRHGQVDAEGKIGVSTGGWIAIGVGAVALAGALIFVGKIVECERDPDDNCGSD